MRSWLRRGSRAVEWGSPSPFHAQLWTTLLIPPSTIWNEVGSTWQRSPSLARLLLLTAAGRLGRLKQARDWHFG
jgi:hypothetical protein